MEASKNILKNYHRLILSLLSALFLFLSFKELGFFAWFALLPFLFTIYKSSLKQTVIFSFICGIGFFMGLTYWMLVLPVKFVWLLLVPLLAVIFLIYGISELEKDKIPGWIGLMRFRVETTTFRRHPESDIKFLSTI